MLEVGRVREKRLSGHEVEPGASLAFQVLYQLPKYIHTCNSINTELKNGTFLLEHCHCHFIQCL